MQDHHLHPGRRGAAQLVKRSAKIGLAAAVLSAVTFMTDAGAQDRPDIRIATASPGGTYYVMGAALAEALYRSGHTASATAEASSGSVENARLMERGMVQFGTMDANWVDAAMAPREPFKQKIELRTAAPLFSAPIFFVTLASSDIKTFDDLKGRRVAVGDRGSGMEQHSRTILGVAGWSFDSDIRAVYQGFAGGGQALRAKQVDAQIQCCIPNGAFTELTQFEKVRLVDLPSELRSSIIKSAPGYGSTVVTPQQVPGLAEEVPSVSLLNGWITHADVDDHTVYVLVKTLLDNLDDLAQRSPQFETIRPILEAAKSEGESALEMGAPLHPGAVRAFREAGYLQ